MATRNEETTLKLTRIDGYDRVTIPYPDARIVRYLTGTFFLAWLGGWAFGEFYVLTEIVLGNAFGFHVFWLIAWTMGGIFTAVTAFRLLRPARPETFTLETDGVRYDRGLPPSGMDSQETPAGTPGPGLKKRRLQTVFTPEQLRTLNLRETGKGNRLTIDVQSDRIELARGATEPEREWLFETLTRRYA